MFQAFRMAIQPTKLVLAFAAIVVICVAGWLMDSASRTVVVGRNDTTELDVYVATVLRPDAFVARLGDSGERAGVFGTLWDFTGRHIHAALFPLLEIDRHRVVDNLRACLLALVWAFDKHFVYSIIFFAIVLGALSVAGGAICRIAALQFARAERLGLTGAARFGLRKFISLFTAAITPVIVILVIGVFIILLGLWGNVPVIGELSVGLLLPLALAAAGVITVILIGAVGGFSLMFPAIAYEDSDCFDGISRSFSYVYARPWRTGFYMVVALVYGAICYAFVRFFLFLVLWVSYVFLGVGFLRENEKLHAIWPTVSFADFLGAGPGAAMNWSMSAGAFLVHLWVLVVIGLMVSFVISFYYSACTIIYALLRHRVDKIALEEVYVYPDTTAVEPSPSAAPTEEAPAQTKPQPPDESSGNAETPT
jgi:hypothetical protein